MRIAVLASGNGSNFAAIARAAARGTLRASSIRLLVTDVKNAYARTRARRYKVPEVFLDPAQFPSRWAFEKQLVKLLKKEKIELVVLAGFMRILTPYFVRIFRGRIINIHPALLPAFPGSHAIERAWRWGVKVTGVTVHFVDEKVDHGPIILQEALRLKEGESLTSLESRIHRIEHRIYPQAISLYCAKKLTIQKRAVTLRKSHR